MLVNIMVKIDITTTYAHFKFYLLISKLVVHKTFENLAGTYDHSAVYEDSRIASHTGEKHPDHFKKKKFFLTP